MQFTNFLMLMLMTNYVTQDTQPHVIVFWDPGLLKLRNDRFKKNPKRHYGSLQT